VKPGVDRLLFTAASSFGSEEEREAFLDYACKGDESMRSLVGELLEVERDALEFFELEPEVENPIVAGNAQDEGIGARIGPYRLIDRLGAGGCGVVYLAEQFEPVKRRVALKIIRLGMDTESVIARFLMEREALAQMDHPNIARVLDVGATASGRPYFAMELVDGEKITDYCDRKRLGVRQRLELFVDVCEAIQHAHQKGVIHRDIKPSNVLVSDRNGVPVPKVIDFGIAKATGGGPEGDATVTRSGQFLGTPAYMSPEQAEGGADIDTRSDIYSLGAMLGELLTGRPPFPHESFEGRGVNEIRTMLRDQETGLASASLRSISSEELKEIAACRAADPQRLPSQIAGDLDWIVMKATEKDRRLRYETANAVAMDVQRHLNEEPVLARPPTRRYRFAKLVRRNRIVFAAGGVALFCLWAGFGTSTWLFFREREARQEQTRLRGIAEKARSNAELARANEARMNRAAKAAELVNQAAVMEKYRDVEEEDRLLGQVIAEDVPGSLEASRMLITTANWNLSHQRWENAAQRFFLLAHVFANVDPADTNVNSQEWLVIAPAVVEWGKPGQFEEVRRLAVDRFSQTTNPVVAEHLIKVSMLTPPDAGTLRAVAASGKVLEGSLEGTNKQRDAHLAAWARCALALLSYRQGDFETSAKQADLSLGNRNEPSRNHWNQVILAMIDLRQGKMADAVEKLDEVRVALRRWEAEPLRPDKIERLGWSNWGSLRILLREAEAMLHTEKPPITR
jgi:eukaryotic-like serine/threonine-protein kinase